MTVVEKIIAYENGEMEDERDNRLWFNLATSRPLPENGEKPDRCWSLYYKIKNFNYLFDNSNPA